LQNIVSSTFEGHETLEQFIRLCNHYEWGMMTYDFGRHANRPMLMPLGQARLQGHDTIDPMNLGTETKRVWREYKSQILSEFGIGCFHTLLHVSEPMFEKVVNAVSMSHGDASVFRECRKAAWRDWAAQGQTGLTFSKLQGLATEIVDQMFEHWDFKAQLQGALQNDFRPPTSIEHLFPSRHHRGENHRINKAIQTEEDKKKFAEIQQFFSLYETTGCTMTHCSLMGTSDMFSTTGKWHFPDAPNVQKQLFENIAWLFPKKFYMYMSERQTVRFPFIEDLDIQASTDWDPSRSPGERSSPPDAIIMDFPQRDRSDVVSGDPGELMRKRALAIHMIYPQLEYLEVLVYSASGFNKGKDMLKSSFHLVWPQLIVDPDIAPIIRHVTLACFQEETKQSGSYLGHIQKRLLELHETNNWELVFDNTTINAKNGLRLPYSDKASMKIVDEDQLKVQQGMLSKTKAAKRRVREDRPSKAVGRIRFEFARDPESGKDIVTKAQWTDDAKSFTIAQWIEMGSCRRDPNNAEKNRITPVQPSSDVRKMLPTKSGEKFDFHQGTHKPFPNIRACSLPPEAFRKQFDDALGEEQEALLEEGKQESWVRRTTVGSWVSATKTQAVWRTLAELQFDEKVDPKLLHRVWSSNQKRIRRPAEVAYIVPKGKVIVDGRRDEMEVLLRVVEQFTRSDDNAILPRYDVTQMS